MKKTFTIKALVFFMIASMCLNGCTTPAKSSDQGDTSPLQPSENTESAEESPSASPSVKDPSFLETPSENGQSILPSASIPSEEPTPSPTPSKDEPVEVSSITLDKTTLTLEEGQSDTLIATVLPEDAADKTVIFESSDPAVLTVDQNGALSALKAGSAVISVKSADGKISATCTVTVVKKIIDVTSITLDKTTLTLEEEQSATLSVTVLPEDASDKTVIFESSDPAVLTVDQNGTLSALKAGSAVISVTSADGKISATCTVTVNVKIVSATSITLDKTSLTLEEEQTGTLSATVLPANATNKTVTFESSDTSVLTVDASGKITAKKVGSAVITVKSGDGKAKATCTVTVKAKTVYASSISLSKGSMTLAVGQSETLSATVLPANATNKKVTFESTNTAVLTVDASGKITAKKVGSAVITVKSGDGKAKATCTVTVKDPIDLIDTKGVASTSDLGGYETTLRVKSTKELLFSPNLPELRAWVNAGGSYDNYTAYLRFTYLAQDEYESDHVFPSIKLTPVKSKGAWVDFFLMGEDLNCGFCPTADSTYKVELVLLSASTGKAVLVATYPSVTAPQSFKDSPYYAPTPGAGTVREEGQMMLLYTALEGGSVSGQRKQLLKAGEKGSAVTATPAAGYTFLCWSDGVKTATRSDSAPKEDTRISAYFVTTPEEGSPVANMYLFTESGQPILTKNYENAFLAILGASDSKYDIAVTTTIKGRGNSSWNGGAAQTNYDSKNSYRLKLDEKEKLLGIGDSKNKDWVLNSNKFDLSSLRNYLVWELADRMGTIPYVPDCTWVQLYINGEYRGLYMVSEHVEAANDRVEVDDSINSADKGYLIEVDFRGNGESDPYFYINGYGAASNDNPREFVIKSDCTESDIAFIKDYMQQCHDAMVSGNRARIEALIDLPSLIDMYIIEELSKDVDVGAASCFLQKDAGGKLYFTAPWDFDFGFGTYGYAISTGELLSSGDRGCTWFAALVKQKWFRQEVYNRMLELDDAFEATMKLVKETGNTLKPAVDKSANFWNMYGRQYHGYVSSNVSTKLKNYDEHVDYLISWSRTRWNTMKELLKN